MRFTLSVTLFTISLCSLVRAQGCDMNAGSALANCLGIGNDCSKLRDNCKHVKNTKSRAKCYCKVYKRAADCWMKGVCCTEYPAHRAAANGVCKIAKQKKPSAKKLAKAQKTAQAVVNQVCHNDCGTDIPCLNNEPMPYHPYGGNCQPRSYWSNGKCTGRHKCGRMRMALKRDTDSSQLLWQ